MVAGDDGEGSVGGVTPDHRGGGVFLGNEKAGSGGGVAFGILAAEGEAEHRAALPLSGARTRADGQGKMVALIPIGDVGLEGAAIAGLHERGKGDFRVKCFLAPENEMVRLGTAFHGLGHGLLEQWAWELAGRGGQEARGCDAE